MVEKVVNVDVLGVLAVKALVVKHDISQGIYVFDLFDSSGNLIAKSRYCLVNDAPFELTEDECSILNPIEEVIE